MIVEIEYYKGDTLLYGKERPYAQFCKEVAEIEADYDKAEDNFIALLCRRYGWTVMEGDFEPIYIYDRDVGKAYRPFRQ